MRGVPNLRFPDHLPAVASTRLFCDLPNYQPTPKMKLTDRPTPETDAIQGNGIHQVTDAFDHARKLERERDYMIRNNNKLRADFDAVAGEACQLQDALGCPCEFEDSQARAMNRIRDLIAAEGELGDAKEKIEKLEAECKRLHEHWHNAEEQKNAWSHRALENQRQMMARSSLARDAIKFVKRQADALKTAIPWITPCGVLEEIEKCVSLSVEFDESLIDNEK